MIGKETVQAFQDSVKTEIIKVNGEEFVTRPVYREPVEQYEKEPQPGILALHSLTALVEYVQKVINADIGPEQMHFLHVISPIEVSVRSNLYGESKQRDTLAVAKFEPAAFPFSYYQNNEEFIVFLQARFDLTEDRDKILRIVGNLKDENVKNFADDGTTQTVVAKAGIARVEEVGVPNPVRLAPFRTFPEIDQPESPFILRMKQGQPFPQCALFEADGGAWANTARESIKEFLKAELPDTTILA
jgi:hypothetical protein